MSNYDHSRPDLPLSPKKASNQPARARSIYETAASPEGSEGFTTDALAMRTSGPIGNKASVEKELSRQVDERGRRSSARRRANELEWSRPYTTSGTRKSK
jgi:hypothetical protein